MQLLTRLAELHSEGRFIDPFSSRVFELRFQEFLLQDNSTFTWHASAMHLTASMVRLVRIF